MKQKAGGAFPKNRSLQDLNLRSLRTLRTVGGHEADALVLFQRLEARTLNLGVGERVLSTRFRGDKAIAFFELNHLTTPVSILYFLEIMGKCPEVTNQSRGGTVEQ